MALSTEEIIDRMQRLSLNIAADADNLIAAPAAGNKICIAKAWFNSPGGVNTITFKAGTAAAGAVIDGLPIIEFVDSGGMVLPYDGVPYAVLPAATALSADLGSATQVTGALYWYLDR